MTEYWAVRHCGSDWAYCDGNCAGCEKKSIGYSTMTMSHFKYDVMDAPTVNAIPVKFIKGELEHLIANRVDADPDDVDYAWDLKMKIEALSDLLGAWEDTYEID